jgi:hypothetical protein
MINSIDDYYLKYNLQTGLVCMNCNKALKRIALGKTTDSGICGDGYRTEYYQCQGCEKLYQRHDMDSWSPVSSKDKQKNLMPCDRLPEDISICGSNE